MAPLFERFGEVRGGCASIHPSMIGMISALLVVDRNYQGQKFAGKTLITALRKASEMEGNGLPAPGFIPDVLNKDALSFYRHFDMFENFTDDPMRRSQSLLKSDNSSNLGSLILLALCRYRKPGRTAMIDSR